MDYITLRMGAHGAQVRQVQRMLLELGYQLGKADGKFGVRTHRAVIAFQSASELPVDGIVAANTWMALERHAGSKAEVAEPLPTPKEETRPEPLPMPAPSPAVRPEPLPLPEAPIVEPPRPPMCETCPVPMNPPIIASPTPHPEPTQPPVQIMPPISWTPAPKLPDLAQEILPSTPSSGRPWTRLDVQTSALEAEPVTEVSSSWTEVAT
ncbi:MAG: peptidoglycan-binding protein [Oscillospiraceae bacterium]|nr:peptidoglycan-binding protein [Oscillospiraceae bacterium]